MSVASLELEDSFALTPQLDQLVEVQVVWASTAISLGARQTAQIAGCNRDASLLTEQEMLPTFYSQRMKSHLFFANRA